MHARGFSRWDCAMRITYLWWTTPLSSALQWKCHVPEWDQRRFIPRFKNRGTAVGCINRKSCGLSDLFLWQNFVSSATSEGSGENVNNDSVFVRIQTTTIWEWYWSVQFKVLLAEVWVQIGSMRRSYRNIQPVVWLRRQDGRFKASHADGWRYCASTAELRMICVVPISLPTVLWDEVGMYRRYSVQRVVDA